MSTTRLNKEVIEHLKQHFVRRMLYVILDSFYSLFFVCLMSNLQLSDCKCQAAFLSLSIPIV